MEIIKFPGAKELNKKAEKKLSIEKVSQYETAMLLGPITVTCRNCSAKSTLTLEGMIFKSLTAYCSCCGTEYTVKNPCFTNVPMKSNNQLRNKNNK